MECFWRLDDTSAQDRHLRASRDIAGKQKVLSQVPLAVQTFQESRGVICDACLAPLVQSFPCSQCDKKVYCSIKCMANDKKFHQPTECKALRALYENGGTPNTLFLITLRLMGMRVSSPLLEGFKDNYSSLDEEKKSFVQQKSVVMAKYLCQAEQKYTLNGELVESIQETLCQVMCNSFTIEEEFSQQKQALAIYPEVNFVNHSCEPNCVQVFSQNRITIYALKDIQEGSALSISYIDNLFPRGERRAFLQDNYLFHCECAKCLRETDQQEIKCPCGDALLTSSCLDCPKCLVSHSSQHLRDVLLRVEAAKTYIMNHPCDSGLVMDKKLQDYAFLFANLGSKNYHHIQALQYLVLDLLGAERFEEALKFLVRLVKVLDKVIDGHSPLLGWKCCEIAKLSFYLKKNSQSKSYSEKSIDILSTYYSGENEQFRQLNERYAYLMEIQQQQQIQ